MRLLHIATDEKFINSINWQFDKLEFTNNKFLILIDSIDTKIKYVALKDNFQIVVSNKKGIQYCIEEINNYDLTIFHGLNYSQSQIVLNTSDSAHLVWCFWGGEFYDNPNALMNSIIGNKTKNIFIKKTVKDRIKLAIRPIFYFLKNQTKVPEQTVLDAAKKIKHFGILYEEELEYFKQLGYLSPKTALFKMTYYPLEFIFNGIEHVRVNGENILIGNSASLTNNHIEAFDKLKYFNLKERKLIIPLSYGDKNYGERVIEIGKSIFGDSLKPVLDFMPLDRFNTLLSTCNVVIMNHYRQQAVGNVTALLWMGAKVYLNENNTFYHYLKRIGIFIYSIDKDLIFENDIALNGLSEIQISKNRDLLINELGFKTVAENLSNALNSIHYND